MAVRQYANRGNISVDIHMAILCQDMLNQKKINRGGMVWNGDILI